MNTMLGLNQYLGSGNMLSITLKYNERLQIFEPIVDYTGIDQAVPISRQVIERPSLDLMDFCSTYYGAMMVGMAKAALMRRQIEHGTMPVRGIRDTHTDDDDSGLGILMPVPV